MTDAGSRASIPFLGVLLAVAVAPVLTSQTLPRDQPAPQDQQRGTAVIRGRVVAEGTNAPMPRVTVVALPESHVPASLRPDSSIAVSPDRSATTDDAGAFEIRGLFAGRYIVAAQIPRDRPQFLTTTYGARDPRDRGKPIDVAPGASVEDIVIAVSRAGAISGRVLNEFGEPVAWARITTLQPRMDGLDAVPTGQGRETDDLGRFRVFGLVPGTYLLKVEPSAVWTTARLHERLRYVPMFYPAAFSEQEAQPIAVEGGQDASDVEIVLRRARTYRVSGTVVASSGRTGRSRISYSRDRRSSMGTVTMPDGTFVLDGLTPGEYTLVGATYEAGDLAVEPEMSNPITLRVDQDINGVSLVLQRGVRLSGQVLIDMPDEKAPPSLRISAYSTAIESLPFPGGPPGAMVKSDGTFTLSRVFGPAVVGPAEISLGRFRAIVLYKGKDITDIPTQFTDVRDPRDLQIVLTDKGAQITGHVKDAEGVPVSDAAVIVFAADERRWGAPHASRFATVDRRGSFAIAPLAAGKYLIVALDSQGAGVGSLVGLATSTIHSRLMSVAAPIELAENEVRQISLTLAKLPQ